MRVLPALLALLASAAVAAPPGDASERLAARAREFAGHGWNSRDRLRAGEADEARRFLAALEEEFAAEPLPAADRLDLDLLRHRLGQLLESWSELDLAHRDPTVWLPTAAELSAALAAPSDSPERAAVLLRLENGARDALAALHEVDREDARAGDHALSPLAKALDDGSPKAPDGHPLRPPLPHFAELLRFLSERRNLADRRTPERARDLRWRRYLLYFRWEVGIDDAPPDILALGKRLYRETEEELTAVARRISPDRPWREIAADLRLDHPDADGLLDACRAEMERAAAFTAEKGFVTVPEWATHVRAEWGEPDDRTPYGHYRPLDPADPELKGAYVVPPLPRLKPAERDELLAGNNRTWIRVVSLHEAIPGHHLQFAVAARRTREVPKWFYNPAYVEGWGLYCEELMARHGYYDDRTRLSQLKMRLWRCARVVIDVGCTFGGMTKDEAVRLLVDGVGLDKAGAALEVDRYLATPGYYSGYIVGRDRLERLLASERARLGPAFDERAFHDRLLSFGPIPFGALQRSFP